MQKINGYTKEEAEALIDFIAEGKKKNKTLSYLFESYGKKFGRAKGSVRNYYYQLLKLKQKNKQVYDLLQNTDLYAEKVREFSDEETFEMLKGILKQKSDGISVRKAIQKLANGDDKLMLRYQNKYRNIIKKQPILAQEALEELGLEKSVLEPIKEKSFLEKRLEQEIDMLYERLSTSLKDENKKLLSVVDKLSRENAVLKKLERLKESRITLRKSDKNVIS